MLLDLWIIKSLKTTLHGFIPVVDFSSIIVACLEVQLYEFEKF